MTGLSAGLSGKIVTILSCEWASGADSGRSRRSERDDILMEKDDITYTQQDDIAYRQQVVNTYKPDVERLIRYLPWLEEKAGSVVAENFEGSGIKGSSITFPVYDGTLMSFIKEVQRTTLLDRNYPYIYSRNRIRTLQDELRAIDRAGIKDMDILKGILSKYVLGGMTKARLWTEGVQNRIFLNVIGRMRQNLEFWDKPML